MQARGGGGVADISPVDADSIAETMHGLATASRVRLLYALRGGERNAGELAAATGLTSAAASQQLRVLRHLRLVTARRDGQFVLYRLQDRHVEALLDEIREHADQLRGGWSAA
jgi:DNA-binding transcriptional ArsR family regulator